MNGELLSEALSGLPEDMVAEAMEPVHKFNLTPWLRFAACVVLIIALLAGSFPRSDEIVTAPGILAVTVYASNSDSMETVDLEEGISFPYGTYWHPGISAYEGLPIRLNVHEDGLCESSIKLEVRLDGGTFVRDPIFQWKEPFDNYNGPRTLYTDTFTVNNGAVLTWIENSEIEDFDGDVAYADIIIYEGEYIVGCSVLHIKREYDGNRETNCFLFTLLNSVAFPKIDGEYQNVTKEYVLQMIEEVKSCT